MKNIQNGLPCKILLMSDKEIEKFFSEQGRNPARWVIPDQDEQLKRISIKAFHALNGIADSPDPSSETLETGDLRDIWEGERHRVGGNFPLSRRPQRR